MAKEARRITRKAVPRARRAALDKMARRFYSDGTRAGARILGVPQGLVRGGVRSRLTGVRTRARSVYFRPRPGREVATIRVFLRPIKFREVGGNLLTSSGRLSSRETRFAATAVTKPRQYQRASQPFIATMPSGYTSIWVRATNKRLPIAELVLPVEALAEAIDRRVSSSTSAEWSRFFGREYVRLVGR